MITELTRGEAADFLVDNISEWPNSPNGVIAPSGWKWDLYGRTICLVSLNGELITRQHWEVKKRIRDEIG
ncbi:hypothetical protein [Edwardsiella phage GF-2]|uniref:Uncharacterized protein n=1 Tax=Edwardsiella phage GF-2 TaxID=1537091 RepID=A0A077KC55_9CAUD|nr:hypothetical protein VC56_gp66 [Edwardsiella phage GF-2]BAP28937.1 hypothetical protein [Edwardsiella phage GF-2]